MTAPFFVAVDLYGGRHTLPSPVSMTHTASLDSPADGLSLSCLVEENLPDCYRLEGYLGERRIFQGGIDEMSYSLTGKGGKLTLTGRTDGSLLLDNEALPLTFVGATLKDVCYRYLDPYGIFSLGFSYPGSLARYIVPKGLCDWEALCEYCRLTLGRQLWLDENLTVRLLPVTGAGWHRISNTNRGGGWLPYTSLTRTVSRHQLVSKVCIRDEDGYYSSALENPWSQRLKIRRKRYLIPPSQYAQQSGEDAQQIIDQSMGEYLGWEVTLPGYHLIAPGDGVELADPGIGEQEARVYQVEHRLTSQGYTTTLDLKTEIQALYG